MWEGAVEEFLCRGTLVRSEDNLWESVLSFCPGIKLSYSEGKCFCSLRHLVDLDFRQLSWHWIWVLGTEPGSSGRGASALNS